MEDEKLFPDSWSEPTRNDKIQALWGYGLIAFVGVVCYTAGKRRGPRYPYSR